MKASVLFGIKVTESGNEQHTLTSSGNPDFIRREKSKQN